MLTATARVLVDGEAVASCQTYLRLEYSRDGWAIRTQDLLFPSFPVAVTEREQILVELWGPDRRLSVHRVPPTAVAAGSALTVLALEVRMAHEGEVAPMGRD